MQPRVDIASSRRRPGRRSGRPASSRSRPGSSSGGRTSRATALDARALAAVGQTHTSRSRLAPLPRRAVRRRRDHVVPRRLRGAARARDRPRPAPRAAAGLARRRAWTGSGASRRRTAETAAERVLDEVESRLRDVLGAGDVGARIEADELAVILAGSGSPQAEQRLRRAPGLARERSGDASRPARVSRPASPSSRAGDDAAGLLERAEHALERASLAGSGTVVVEMAADEARD